MGHEEEKPSSPPLWHASRVNNKNHEVQLASVGRVALYGWCTVENIFTAKFPSLLLNGQTSSHRYSVLLNILSAVPMSIHCKYYDVQKCKFHNSEMCVAAGTSKIQIKWRCNRTNQILGSG